MWGKKPTDLVRVSEKSLELRTGQFFVAGHSHGYCGGAGVGMVLTAVTLSCEIRGSIIFHVLTIKMMHMLEKVWFCFKKLSFFLKINMNSVCNF